MARLMAYDDVSQGYDFSSGGSGGLDVFLLAGAPVLWGGNQFILFELGERFHPRHDSGRSSPVPLSVLVDGRHA